MSEPAYPIGEINVTVNCCPDIPGTTPPSVAPYVVSIGGRQGIVGLEATGAFSIGYNAATNSIILGVAAGSGLGTVTSVGLSSSSTGLVVTGATPITTFGSFALSLDATLQALSQVVTAADLLIYATGVDTFATTSLTAFARTLLDDASAATARGTLGGTTIGQALFTLTNPSQVGFIRTDVANTVTARTAAETRTDLSLVIGTNVQAWSADLDEFVVRASWSAGNVQFTGGVFAAGQLVTSVQLQIAGPVPSGTELLQVTTDGNDLLILTDHGRIDLTLDYTGATSCITVTNSAAGVAMDLSANGNVSFLGTVSAAQFDGDGAALTNLSASELNSGTVPSARIAGAYSGITGLGTIATGVWQGTIITGQYGGTGVNNSGKTITLGGNVTTSGAFNVTFTLTAGTNVTLPTSGTLYGTASGSITSAQLATSVTDETGSGSLVFGTSPAILTPTITAPSFDKTITAAGATGNKTINTSRGSVRFAAAATSLVVTNSLCTVNSVLTATVGSNDATMKSAQAVAANGTFTLYPDAAPTAECICYFTVDN